MYRKKQKSLIQKLVIPIISLILLTSCTKSADISRALHGHYREELCFDAKVRVCAELDDERQEYVLEWAHEKGRDSITVLEPEIIAGMTAETDGETAELVYDGLRLAVEPTMQTISPVEALAELCTDWYGGVYTDAGFELLDGENTYTVTFEHKKRDLELMQRVWFDCESLKPLKAELYTGERLAESFEFLYFDERQEGD